MFLSAIVTLSSAGPNVDLLFDIEANSEMDIKSDLAITVNCVTNLILPIIYPQALSTEPRNELIGPLPFKMNSNTETDKTFLFVYPFLVLKSKSNANLGNQQNIGLIMFICSHQQAVLSESKDMLLQILSQQVKSGITKDKLTIDILKQIADAIPGKCRSIASGEVIKAVLKSQHAKNRDILIIGSADLQEQMINIVKRLISFNTVYKFIFTEVDAQIFTIGKINFHFYWRDKDFLKNITKYHGIIFVGSEKLEQYKGDFFSDFSTVCKKTTAAVPIAVYFHEAVEEFVLEVNKEMEEKFGANLMKGRSLRFEKILSSQFIDLSISEGLLWISSLL